MIFLSCYSLIKNDCDGRCQGCSSCPIAKKYHNESNEKITLWVMFKYILL